MSSCNQACTGARKAWATLDQAASQGQLLGRALASRSPKNVALRRRVGLLPPVKRPRTYATAPRKAARAAPPRRRLGRPTGLLLGSGPGSAATHDDSDSSGSSTSSDASDADSGGRGGQVLGVLGNPKTGAASAGRAHPQSPVRWSASSGGVRHGAAPSRSSGRMLLPASPRRPPHPARSPGQTPGGAQPASPRGGRGRGHCAEPASLLPNPGPTAGSRGPERAAPGAAAEGARGCAGAPSSPRSPRQCLPFATDSPRGSGHAGKPSPRIGPDPSPGSPRQRAAARLAAPDRLGAGVRPPEQGAGQALGRLSVRVGSLYDDQRTLRSLRSRPQLPALPALTQALQAAACPQALTPNPTAPAVRGADGLGLGRDEQLSMLPPLRLPPRAAPLPSPARPIDALTNGGKSAGCSAHGHPEAGTMALLQRCAAAGSAAASGVANGGAHSLSTRAPSTGGAAGSNGTHSGHISAKPRRSAPAGSGGKGAGAHSGAGPGLSAAASGSCSDRGAHASAGAGLRAPATSAAASAPGGPCAPFRPPRLAAAKGADPNPAAAANKTVAQHEAAPAMGGRVGGRRKGAP